MQHKTELIRESRILQTLLQTQTIACDGNVTSANMPISSWPEGIEMRIFHLLIYISFTFFSISNLSTLSCFR